MAAVRLFISSTGTVHASGCEYAAGCERWDAGMGKTRAEVKKAARKGGDVKLCKTCDPLSVVGA